MVGEAITRTVVSRRILSSSVMFTDMDILSAEAKKAAEKK